MKRGFPFEVIVSPGMVRDISMTNLLLVYKHLKDEESLRSYQLHQL